MEGLAAFLAGSSAGHAVNNDLILDPQTADQMGYSLDIPPEFIHVDIGLALQEGEGLLQLRIQLEILSLGEHFQPHIGLPIADVQSMTNAVEAAYRMAEPGDTVLLSPCCASFDLFSSYEDRGRQFKECVKKL